MPTKVTNSNTGAALNSDFDAKTTPTSDGLVQHVNIDNDPLSYYKISDLDEATSTKYYGFLNTSGGWYVLKMTATAARYVKGTSDYTTNWTNRAALTYDYFDAVF